MAIVIVSEGWIEQSTKARSEGLPLYGYQWWVGDSAIGERSISWIAGIGFGGQRIYIVPAYDLVAVITAGLYASTLEDQASVVGNIFDQLVLAAIRE
jgi:CubicO group peptidase (beta-lactamase class C family)